MSGSVSRRRRPILRSGLEDLHAALLARLALVTTVDDARRIHQIAERLVVVGQHVSTAALRKVNSLALTQGVTQ